MRRPGLSLVAVLAVLVAGVGTAMAVPTAETAASAPAGLTRVPVSSATLVCPAPLVDDDSTTTVGVLAGLGLDGEPPAGSAPGAATLTRLDGTVRADVPAGHGRLDYPAVTDDGPLVVSATGSLAPGLAASMFTRTSGGEARGLAGTGCAAPGTDFWFVGSGSQIGRRGAVYLTNPSDAVAVADVTLYGPDGPITSSATRGLAVAAHSQQVLQLDALAPDMARLAVHVEVRQGGLAAAVRDAQVKGLDPLGVDWVPQASAPARHQVVPFVPGGGGGDRVLQLVAPGDADAVVALRVATSEGTFSPVGLESVDVPAGTVTEVDIAAVADAEGNEVSNGNFMVRLDADVPVTASVLARRGAAGLAQAELAWTSAATPVAGPAVVATGGVGGAVRSELHLLAPERAGSVEVSLVAPDGRRTTQRVRLEEGAATTVPLAPPEGVPAFAVVVRPEQGLTVYGARMLTEIGSRGPLFSIEPLRPVTVEVSVPRVVRDLSTGLRAGTEPADADGAPAQSSSSP